MSENKNNYKKITVQSPFIIISKLYIAGIAAFLAILSIFSVLVMNMHTSDELLQLYVIADGAAVSFIISLICCTKIQNKRLICGLSLSALTAISEFILILCFNNADICPQTYILIPAVMILSFMGCISGCNIRIKGKKRRTVR